MAEESVKYIRGPPGHAGPCGPMGRDGRNGRDGKCECKDLVDDLITKNKILEDKIKKLEAMVEELYYSPDIKGPGFLAAQSSFHEKEQEVSKGT